MISPWIWENGEIPFVYAIKSIFFIRFFPNLHSVLIAIRAWTLLNMRKIGQLSPELSPLRNCENCKILLVYAIKSTFFIWFFPNLNSVLVPMRNQTLLKMSNIKALSQEWSHLEFEKNSNPIENKQYLRKKSRIPSKLEQCLHINIDSILIENEQPLGNKIWMINSWMWENLAIPIVYAIIKVNNFCLNLSKLAECF